MEKHYRNLDPVRVFKRRPVMRVWSIADEFAHQVEITPTAVLLLERPQVGYRRNRDHGLKHRGVDHRRLQGGISAIRPTNDGELGWVGDPLVHEPPTGIQDVSDRNWPGPESVLLEPPLTITARSAEVGLEYGEAAGRVILREPAESPLIAGARPTVGHHDRWQALRVLTARG